MRRWILATLILGILAGLVLACYGPAIFGGEQFAFRDAGNFYYPLHRRVQAEWDAGRWPLWEPEENSGMPLLGNPTAAVLYPGKVVFALLDYPDAARAYIIGHTLLAFLAMLALLRHWETTWVGSTLGALAFAFGAPVLFQYCNIIYLVGASWLPLAIRAIDRWLRLGKRLALAELAVVLAMQVLGGDPETAYLSGVCAAGYAVFLAKGEGGADGPRSGRRGKVIRVVAVSLALWVGVTLVAAAMAPMVLPAPTGAGPRTRPLPWASWVGPVVTAAWGVVGLVMLLRWRRQRRAGGRPVLLPMLLGLAGSAAVAAAFSAAQLLPTMEFIGQSGRAASGGDHDIYPFSLAPSQLAGMVWPNLFGSLEGGNTFWLEAVPPRLANANPWVYSPYLGGLTLVLALGGTRLRPGGVAAPWRAWLVAIAAVGLVGSLGEFGSPLWMARQLPGVEAVLGPSLYSVLASSPSPSASPLPANPRTYLQDHIGSVYWLLANALPGFDQFRYPSKLLTFTALALASLAGQGWDTLTSGDPRARRRSAAWSGALLAITLVALAMGVALRGGFVSWIEARDVVSSNGPVDAAAAVARALAGLLQAAGVFAVALVLALRLVSRRPAIAGALVLVVAGVDLGLANSHLVMTVPQEILETTPGVVSVIEQAERDRPTPGPFRIHRMPIWGLAAWSESRSTDRLDGVVSWSRRTLDPKYAINYGLPYTLAFGVTELYDYRWFFGGFHFTASERAAVALGIEPGTRIIAYPRRAFDMWNTRYFVLPYYARWDDQNRGIGSFLELTERIHPPPDAFSGPDGERLESEWARDHDVQVRRNLAEYPRAWVVHEARPLPPFRGLGRTDRQLPMQEILFANDLTWSDPARISYDPRRFVWLDEAVMPDLAPYLPGGYPSSAESVRVAALEPQRVELEATLERPGIVVLSDVYYPGWALEIDGQPAPLLRANRLMRGAAVDSGRHTLVFSYRPASFRVGLVGSGLGLAALALLVIWSGRAPSPARPGSSPASTSHA